MSNGTGAGSVVTYEGTTALWIGFAVLFVAGIVFWVMSYIRNVKAEARFTYYLITLSALIGALGYLIMALGDVTMNAHNGNYAAPGRQFEWVRYATWTATIFTLLPTIGLLAGAHWVNLLWVIFASILSVGAFFAAAISQGGSTSTIAATWPLFAFGAFCGIPVMIAILFTWRRSAAKVHPEIGRLYNIVSYMAAIFFLAYLIVIAVSECGFVTTVDQELIVFTVLDLLTKVVLGAFIIYGRESIARYGTYHGLINTGLDIDFPIERSTYTGSGSNYATEPKANQTIGEHRDLAFAQLHTATSTGLTRRH